MVYELQGIKEVNRATNLVITDSNYFEEANPILEIHNQSDGLYEVYTEKTEEKVGTFGIDTCNVAIFKLKDLKNKEILKKKFLYTVIPTFKGIIALYSCEDDWGTNYLLKFDGYSKGNKVDWITEF